MKRVPNSGFSGALHKNYTECKNSGGPYGIISNKSPLQGPVPEEPVPEALPVEGDSKQCTSPRVPADADCWPRASLLPGDTPNAEMPQEILAVRLSVYNDSPILRLYDLLINAVKRSRFPHRMRKRLAFPGSI